MRCTLLQAQCVCSRPSGAATVLMASNHTTAVGVAVVEVWLMLLAGYHHSRGARRHCSICVCNIRRQSKVAICWVLQGLALESENGVWQTPRQSTLLQVSIWLLFVVVWSLVLDCSRPC